MINDDDLLLYHYEDGLSSARRAEITAALAQDEALRARLARLQAECLALREWPTPPPSRATQARWRAALARQARVRRESRGLLLQWALACTLLLLGIGIGVRMAERAPDVPVVADTRGEPALVRGVRTHLGDTRQLLASWDASAPDQRLALLADVLAQNRAYVAAAERTGDQRLARVLRAFEPVLLQLAQPEVSAEHLDGTRAQLDFELGAMQTKLSRTPSNGMQRL